MLEILGMVFGSIFSGGATGIIGVIAQRFADYKNKQLDMELEKQRFENQVQLRRVDAEIMAQEWAARTKVAEVEAAGKEAVADAAAFAASYQLEPKRYSDETSLTHNQQWVMVLLDTLRGSIRPVLTLYLCILATIIYLLTRDKLKAVDLGPEQALDLIKLLIGSILYLWTTVTLWWFGTRNKSASPK